MVAINSHYDIDWHFRYMGKFSDWLLGADIESRAEVIPPSDPTDVRPPSRLASARAVSQSDALSISSVYRAVTIISTAATQLGVDVYRNGAAVSIPSYVRKPNVSMSQAAFLEQTVTSLALAGNAYWLIERDNRGAVTNLAVANPQDVAIEATAYGTVTGYTYRGKTLKASDVSHLALLRVPGSVYGLGPIQAAQVELRGSIDTRNYASNWFENSGIPSGVLKSDSHLTAEAAAQAKASWNDSQGGAHGVAVLGNGLSYDPVFLSPEDAQWLEAQRFSTTAVARLFGTPSSLMLANVEGSSQTYANIESEWIAFSRFTLMAYVQEIEEAFSTLLPGAQRVKFNLDALLRSDTLTRYQAHAIGRSAGFMTVNEIRALENLPPIDGGDVLSPATPTLPAETDAA